MERCCPGIYKKTLYDKYDHRRKTLVYEYRGHEYFIEINIFGQALGEDISLQHKKAQEDIDKMLDNKSDVEYSGEIEKALNQLWEFWDG